MLTHRQKKTYPNNIRSLISNPKTREAENSMILIFKENSYKKITAPDKVVWAFVCPSWPATLPHFWKEACGTNWLSSTQRKTMQLIIPICWSQPASTLSPALGRPHQGCYSVKCIQSWLIEGPCTPHDLQVLAFQETSNFASQQRPRLAHLLLTVADGLGAWKRELLINMPPHTRKRKLGFILGE